METVAATMAQHIKDMFLHGRSTPHEVPMANEILAVKVANLLRRYGFKCEYVYRQLDRNCVYLRVTPNGAIDKTAQIKEPIPGEALQKQKYAIGTRLVFANPQNMAFTLEDEIVDVCYTGSCICYRFKNHPYNVTQYTLDSVLIGIAGSFASERVCLWETPEGMAVKVLN